MLKLEIPQLGEDSKNVKDLVFTILTEEQPFSIMELYNRIKTKYAASITYQAVRKAVNNLEEHKILEKTNKKYSINKEWVLKIKSYFDKLLTTYETGSKPKVFTADLAKEDYAIYTFNNLYDLDNFWGDIQLYWAQHEKTNKTFFSNTHYNWWFIINFGLESKIFDLFKKKKIKSYCIFRNKKPLNLWAQQIYTQYKVKSVFTTVADEDPLVDINILGDIVIQVHYPKNIARRLRSFFQKYKNMQEISVQEITQIAHLEGEIKFVMFKNPLIAKRLCEGYVKMF
jgi:hypothetical protein